MTPVVWQVSLTFILFDIRFLIVGKNGPTSILAQGPDGHLKSVQIRELVQWLEKGDLVIEHMPKTEESGRPIPLEAIPEAGKKVARERLRIIGPLIKMRTVSPKIVQMVARQHECSSRSIYRYLQAFKRGGFRALVPEWMYQAEREPSLRNKVHQAVVDEVVTQDLLTLTAPRISNTYSTVAAKCLLAGVKPLSRSAFYRYVSHIPKRTLTLSREGQQAHDNRFLATPTLFTRKSAKFPLYLVLIDHTELDVQIVDEENRVAIGRPWLTLGFDAFSRMPWSMYLSLDHPSAISLMMAFRHGVLLKHAVERYATKHEWHVFGIPKTVLVDNGKEFHSIHFADLCAFLRSTILYRPRRTPRFGGLIERAFGSLDMRLIHGLVGNTKTMKNVRHKSHNPEDVARLTIAELHEILTVYFTDIYPHLKHRGLDGKTPFQRWQEGLEFSGFPASPSNVAQFMIESLPTETRIMSRQGISYSNILYYHPRLSILVGQELTIKWDPWNLSHLYVWLSKSQEWLEVFCHEPEGMKMSSMEYRIVKALLKANDEPIDEASIRSGWARIHGVQVEAGRAQDKLHQKRKRHGASSVLNLGKRPSPNPEGAMREKWDGDWDAPAVTGLPPL